MSVAAILVLWLPLAVAQTRPQFHPDWSKTFRRDFWVINSTVSGEFGIVSDDDGMPADLGSMDSLELNHSTMLVLEGSPQDGGTLHALDAHDGSVLWQRTAVRLNRWRPLPSYLPGRRVEAHYADIVGGVALLWLAKDVLDDGAGCGSASRLAAVNVRTGTTAWCTRDIPDGEVTFVPLPARQTVLAWSAAAQRVTLTALDLRTGATRWRHTLDIRGPDWSRAVWFTALPAPVPGRPPLEFNGYVPFTASRVGPVGPLSRARHDGVVQMIDLASGKLRWQAVQPLDGRSWLSWASSDTTFFLTTGTLVAAYDLSSGAARWSIALDDVRSLRVVRAPSREVLLVDFGPRTRMWRPNRAGRGLAAIDARTGEVLWREPSARTIHALDGRSETVLVFDERHVRRVDVATGRETVKVSPPFRDGIRHAGLLGSNRVIVQSATEVAVYGESSTSPSFQQSVPREQRALARFVLSALLAWPELVVEAAVPGWTGLRSRAPRVERSSPFAFFATGREPESQLVAVNVEEGTTLAVAPYIWPDRGRLSLGNLLSEGHGIVYTLLDRTLAAYRLPVNQAEHQRTHRLDDLQRALEMRDRATALAGIERRDIAGREAVAALAALEPHGEWRDEPNGVRVLAYATRGDAHSLLAVIGDRDRAEHTRSGIVAYEAALALLANTAGADAADVAAIERQLATLRRR